MKGKIKETLNVLTGIHDFPIEMFDETKRFKILIVDDEIDYLELIERYVISFGYDCITAQDGEQALERLQNYTCDLVITDMLMPNMDGMQLLKKIHDAFPHVATIVLSGYCKSFSFKDIIQAGAYEFLEKPVNKDALEAKIERVFREKMLMVSYLNEIKTQKILVDLLTLTTTNKPLSELLHDFLLCIASFPWLELEPRGAVFLVDEQDNNRLIMRAHHNNLAEQLKEICACVPFGHCMWGLAAQTKKVIFCDHIGKAHHNCRKGIQEHGHYCVPILLNDNELLGVFTLYLKAGAVYSKEAENMLRTAAQTIAGIIISKQTLREKERLSELLAERTRQLEQELAECGRGKAALLESKEEHRAIIQTAMDGFWMADMQGRLLEVNETYCRMSGYSEPELLAMRIVDLEAVETDEEISTHIQRIKTQGEERFDSRHRRKDGSIFDLEVHVQYRPASGRFVAFSHDITERRKAEVEEWNHLHELLRWQDVMLDREDRVRDLKKEVNELCRRMGETGRYACQEAGPADEAVVQSKT